MSTELQPAEAYYMLPCVGSHELGCLTLGVMQPGISYTATRIQEDVMQLQGEAPVWNMHQQMPYTYFTKFANGGLVVPDTDSSYRLTERGDRIGKAVAGHLVGLSAQVKPAQLEFVGPHAVKGENIRLPVHNRIAILRELAKTGDKPISGIELQTAMNAKTKLHTLLGVLASLDIISMETSKKKPMTIYGPGPQADILPTIGSRAQKAARAAIDAVRSMLDKGPDYSFTNTDVAERIRQREPAFAEGMSMQELTLIAHRTTHYLKTCGVLAKHEEKAGGGVVWLNESQLFLASRLLEIFDGLRKPTQTYLDEGRAALDEIMKPESRDVVHQLVSKAMYASTRHQNAENRKATLSQRILDILNKSERRPLTDIHAELLDAQSTTAHINRTEKVLQRLADQGKVNITRLKPGATAQRLFSSAERDNKLRLVEYWGNGERRTALRRYVARKISDWQTAEDVLGEVFASIMDPKTRTLHLNQDNDCTSWIYAVASNKIADYYRRNYRRERTEDKVATQYAETEISFEAEAVANLDKRNLQQVLVAALKEADLTPAQMRVLALELTDPEMSTAEGAERLGGTPLSFRVGRSRLRSRLRPILLQRLKEASDAGLYIPPEYLRIAKALSSPEEDG